jgi:hypothetical protein
MHGHMNVQNAREIQNDTRDIEGQGPCTDNQITPPTVNVRLLIRLVLTDKYFRQHFIRTTAP